MVSQPEIVAYRPNTEVVFLATISDLPFSTASMIKLTGVGVIHARPVEHRGRAKVYEDQHPKAS